MPCEVTGREHVPKTGPCVFVANHQSFLDIPFFAAQIPRHVCFVARGSLAESRLLAYIMNQAGCVLVKRGESDLSAVREIVAHLKGGDAVCVFPEGTRSKDGSIGEFRRGALLAARRGNAPVIPVGISGSFEAWPPGQKWPHPHRIRFAFGEPIDPRGENALEIVRERVVELAASR
jgi:1-acyl-sn-glycerol-3-phosphate acyltransferase